MLLWLVSNDTQRDRHTQHVRKHTHTRIDAHKRIHTPPPGSTVSHSVDRQEGRSGTLSTPSEDTHTGNTHTGNTHTTSGNSNRYVCTVTDLLR